MYDPKTQKYTLINTCFPTHHVQFGFDKDNTAWVSAGGPHSGVAGWVNMRMLEETGDEAEGARLDPVHPRHQRRRQARRVHRAEPAVRSRTRIAASTWRSTARRRARSTARCGAPRSAIPGYVVRLDPTKPATRPRRRWRRSTKSRRRATARAASTSTPRASSGSRCRAATWRAFDRRKCKVLNGPTIRDGKHCPEGWTLYPFPGPKLAGDPGTGSAEASYYTWVDQHDMLGLGKDIPFATGNQNESLIALKDGKMVNLVVPYPMGFYAKTFDGRIDDPNAGWKGRGIWASRGQPHAVPRGRHGKGERAEADEDPASSGSARALSGRRAVETKKPARLVRAGRVCFRLICFQRADRSDADSVATENGGCSG